MQIKVYLQPNGEKLTEFDKGHKNGSLFAIVRHGMFLRYAKSNATVWRILKDSDGLDFPLYRDSGRSEEYLFTRPKVTGKAHVSVDVYHNETSTLVETIDLGVYQSPLINIKEIPWRQKNENNVV